MRFDVKDTGPGLSPEDQARAFEEFVQLGAERPGELRGTGLGLPLTRRLAAILGGEIGVRSTLGEGATFSVTVPAPLPARASRASTSSTTTEPPPRAHRDGVAILARRTRCGMV